MAVAQASETFSPPQLRDTGGAHFRRRPDDEHPDDRTRPRRAPSGARPLPRPLTDGRRPDRGRPLRADVPSPHGSDRESAGAGEGRPGGACDAAALLAVAGAVSDDATEAAVACSLMAHGLHQVRALLGDVAIEAVQQSRRRAVGCLATSGQPVAGGRYERADTDPDRWVRNRELMRRVVG